MATSIPDFHLVPGTAIASLLAGAHADVMAVVAEAYRLHAGRDSVNPDSYFLRFKDKPSARIIALPAFLGGRFQRAGLKWISSFPANTASNIPRASAVLILNDYENGYPLACLESSLISAHRTAASAALAAEALSARGRTCEQLAVVGAGTIARQVLEYLVSASWQIGSVKVYDTKPEDAQRLCAWLRAKGIAAEAVHGLEDACATADLVVFATTAGEPHVLSPSVFERAPTVLHLSLRDLSPAVILAAQNTTDDVEHCMKAQTSLHLTEQQVGSRSFVAGTLADLMSGAVAPDPSRLRIFSPFGLGVLDIAVGTLVLDRALSAGLALKVDGFYSEARRW